MGAEELTAVEDFRLHLNAVATARKAGLPVCESTHALVSEQEAFEELFNKYGDVDLLQIRTMEDLYALPYAPLRLSECKSPCNYTILVKLPGSRPPGSRVPRECSVPTARLMPVLVQL